MARSHRATSGRYMASDITNCLPPRVDLPCDLLGSRYWPLLLGEGLSQPLPPLPTHRRASLMVDVAGCSDVLHPFPVTRQRKFNPSNAERSKIELLLKAATMMRDVGDQSPFSSALSSSGGEERHSSLKDVSTFILLHAEMKLSQLHRVE